MDKINKFLKIINSLNPEIKNHIVKMNLPYDTVAYADSDKDISESLAEFLSKIHKNIPKSLHNAIPYIIGELTDNIDQHSNYSHAYTFLKSGKNEELEIVVFDDGKTIPAIFEKNNVNFIKDCIAIKMVLKVPQRKKKKLRGVLG